jgi:hypothetical protein
MYKFELNNKEYNIPNCWEDMTLGDYIRIMKLEEKKDDYLVPELYLIKMIETLTNISNDELDDMDIDCVEDIIKNMNLGFLGTEPKWEHIKHINIDGVEYVFPKDLNKLKMGEVISIKTLQSQIPNEVDVIPYILAVLLRPGKLVKNEETSEEEWVQDKFDAENIEHRIKIFMNQPIVKLMGNLTFFLNGRK